MRSGTCRIAMDCNEDSILRLFKGLLSKWPGRRKSTCSVTQQEKFSMGRFQNEPTQSDRTTWHTWGLQTIDGPFFVVLIIMPMVCWVYFGNILCMETLKCNSGRDATKTSSKRRIAELQFASVKTVTST